MKIFFSKIVPQRGFSDQLSELSIFLAWPAILDIYSHGLLKGGKSVLSNCRVDAHVDCLALIQAWERQGGKSKQLNDALKELFQTLLAQNVSLCAVRALSSQPG